jgi:hypothetical protein
MFCGLSGFKETHIMRAEMETLVDDIKQSVELLRRRL